MTTKLDGILKREVNIDGKPYTLTLSPLGFNLAPKGRRKGYELAWVDFISGEAALATALNASIARGPKPDVNPASTGEKHALRNGPRPGASTHKAR